MVTTFKRVFSALCGGSQRLLGINNADSRECQHTALVRMELAHSLPKCGALGSHTPTHVCHLPLHNLDNNLKMVKLHSLNLTRIWATFLSC